MPTLSTQARQMPQCPRCNGTGNAGDACIAADGDPTGCIQCGGCGYLDWRNDVFRVVLIFVILPAFVWALFQITDYAVEQLIAPVIRWSYETWPAIRP
jgi:hypothetical protein